MTNPSGLDWYNRLTLIAAGILGATGITAAAAASHVGDTRILGSLALVALTQAPALAALHMVPPTRRILRIATLVIAGGAVLFSADLGAHHIYGHAILPLAAPIGGSALIAGWLLVALAGAIGRRS